MRKISRFMLKAKFIDLLGGVLRDYKDCLGGKSGCYVATTKSERRVVRRFQGGNLWANSLKMVAFVAGGLVSPALPAGDLGCLCQAAVKNLVALHAILFIFAALRCRLKKIPAEGLGVWSVFQVVLLSWFSPPKIKSPLFLIEISQGEGGVWGGRTYG